MGRKRVGGGVYRAADIAGKVVDMSCGSGE